MLDFLVQIFPLTSSRTPHHVLHSLMMVFVILRCVQEQFLHRLRSWDQLLERVEPLDLCKTLRIIFSLFADELVKGKTPSVVSVPEPTVVSHPSSAGISEHIWKWSVVPRSDWVSSQASCMQPALQNEDQNRESGRQPWQSDFIRVGVSSVFPNLVLVLQSSDHVPSGLRHLLGHFVNIRSAKKEENQEIFQVREERWFLAVLLPESLKEGDRVVSEILESHRHILLDSEIESFESGQKVIHVLW
jgi:hypothetical protein